VILDIFENSLKGTRQKADAHATDLIMSRKLWSMSVLLDYI